MKTFVISLINFILNPILFVEFVVWGRRLHYTPYKRQQYSLLSANLSLFPVWRFGYRLTKVQAQLITVIFEIDHYVDQVIRTQPDYAQKFAQTLTDSPVSASLAGVLRPLSVTDRQTMLAEVKKVVELTDVLDNSTFQVPQEYFDLTSYSIAIPCITKLVSICLDEQLSSPTILRACSEIIRIINDAATIDKDRNEGAKNAYILFPAADIDTRLKQHLAELKAFEPQNRIDLFLKRLTRLGLLLYKKKDFEL